MSKVEDFRYAPVGAIATHANGSRIRAMKMNEVYRYWMTQNGVYLSDAEMEQRGYLLDPLEPAPTTAREALDLAWELAHPVKNGQVIPKGTQYLGTTGSGVKEYTAPFDIKIGFHSEPERRTLEPLPEPEPDWLNAPAVMARVEGWVSCADPQVFTRYDYEAAPSEWLYNGSEKPFRWQDLRDVTPLYPREQDQ